jgi:hypothetical protein
VTPVVRVGSVYEDIGDAAAEIDADLIIMGTHGMRGMQFITGSRALRVITSSSVPFVVVQERPIKEGATTTSWCRWTCIRNPAEADAGGRYGQVLQQQGAFDHASRGR